MHMVVFWLSVLRFLNGVKLNNALLGSPPKSGICVMTMWRCLLPNIIKPSHSPSWNHITLSCTGWGWVSGSTTNWQFSYTAASTAWLRRTLPTTSSVWRTSTPGGVFAQHQRVHSSCLWRACQQSETARFRWPRLACVTVCRPMSHRRHRCRHSRDGLRQNCLFGAIHSSAASDILFFTARAARTSFRFFLFLFCKVS